MIDAHDEGLARADRVGTAVHHCIASLASMTRHPTLEQVKAVAETTLTGFRPVEARAHRQNIRGPIHAYFWHLLPPSSFLFAGHEVQLGHGRIDLLWRSMTHRLLLDEVKTGLPERVELSAVRQQCETYLAGAHSQWGRGVLGLRLLSTSDVRRSMFLGPDGTWVSLWETPFTITTSQEL